MMRHRMLAGIDKVLSGKTQPSSTLMTRAHFVQAVAGVCDAEQTMPPDVGCLLVFSALEIMR